MRLLSHLRNGRRLLRWCGFVLALAGVAWMLDALLPAEPRWVVRGSITSLGFTHDGKGLITATRRFDHLPSKVRSPMFAFQPLLSGPIEFRDLATGQPIWSVLGEDGPRWQTALSDDRKQLAALAPPVDGAGQDELRLIDLTTRQERRTMVEHREAWAMSFGPGGALLLFEDMGWTRGNERKEAHLYATASLRFLGKVPPRDRWPHWRWSADGKALLTCTTDERGTVAVRRLTAGGETVIPLKGAGDWLDFTPDGKTLLTDPPRADAKDGALIDAILLWDVPAGTRRGAVAVEGFPSAASGNSLVFTQDRRTLVLTMVPPRGRVIGVWDLETAQWLAKVPVDANTTPFFPGPNALILRREAADLRVAWHQLRPFARLWEHAEPGAALVAIDYLPNLRRLVVTSSSTRGLRLLLLEPQTGATTLDLLLDPHESHHWLSDGKHFALLTWHRTANERSPIRNFIEDHLLALLMPHRQRGDATPTTTQFFDIATGAEICRIDHAGADPDAITPDGDALILYQEAGTDGEAAIICYDVPPARPWRFIIGIPLGLGVLLLSVRVGWRRFRRTAPSGNDANN